MAPETPCPACGNPTFAVPSHWGDKTLFVERGKIEVATFVPQTKTYITHEGFKIHRCKTLEGP